MSTTPPAEFDINTLLDGTLDDLADLPEFKPFPAGVHRVNVKLEQKLVNKHPCFEAKYKLIETVELVQVEGVVAPIAGSEASQLFMLDNEIGQGQFKKLMAIASEKFGAKSNRELVADLQNAELLIVTKLRPNKDKTVVYMDVVEYALV